MAAVLTPTKPKAPAKTDGLGRNGGGSGREGLGGPGGSGGADGDARWEPAAWSVPARTYRTGMWMALAAIVMLFAAFTSAMVIRQGISNDWVRTALPHVLYLNTLVLLTSSLTLELSRRSLAQGSGAQYSTWLQVTLGLGLTFVCGQLIAWRELASRGVYLSTNPSSSFLYLLTGAHGIHLLGGIGALFYLVFRARKVGFTPSRHTATDVTAIYWHFMDGLWIYILLLLTVRL